MIYLWLNGTHAGPFEEKEVRARLKRKTITSETLACRENDKSWSSVEYILKIPKIPIVVRQPRWPLMFSVPFFLLGTIACGMDAVKNPSAGTIGIVLIGAVFVFVGICSLVNPSGIHLVLDDEGFTYNLTGRSERLLWKEISVMKAVTLGVNSRHIAFRIKHLVERPKNRVFGDASLLGYDFMMSTCGMNAWKLLKTMETLQQEEIRRLNLEAPNS